MTWKSILGTQSVAKSQLAGIASEIFAYTSCEGDAPTSNLYNRSRHSALLFFLKGLLSAFRMMREAKTRSTPTRAEY
jgi:hypothetical protein